MNDFIRTKITFTIALLASLFAISPILNSHGHIGFILWGIKWEIQYAYYILTSLVGFAVYLYAIAFITEKRKWNVIRVANYLYGLAMISPFLFFALFLVRVLEIIVISVSKSKDLGLAISFIAGTLVGILGVVLIRKIKDALISKQRNYEASKMNNISNRFLAQANSLFNSKHYGHAVIDANKAVEFALRKLLVTYGIDVGAFNPTRMLTQALNKQLINSLIVSKTSNLRVLRNQCLHDHKTMDAAETRRALNDAQEIIETLTDKISQQDIE